MMMRTLIYTSALTIGWGVVVFAQTPDDVSPFLGSFEAGILCAQEPSGIREAPDTVAGTTHVIDTSPDFVNTGRVVPAVIGIGFGVRAGLGDVGLDGVLMTVTHPPLEGSGVTEQSFMTSIGSSDEPGLTFYQFDEDYELALGEWRMTATTADAQLYDVTFTVVPPAALPELAGACGYLDLLS